MNWIPKLLAVSNGDLTTPEAMCLGNLLWENSNPNAYIVDDSKSFNSIVKLSAFLHVGNATVQSLMAEADHEGRTYFDVAGHVVKLNPSADKKYFRSRYYH